MGQKQLSFKLRKKRNSYFILNNECTLEINSNRNNNIIRSNLVTVTSVIYGKSILQDCSYRRWRI